MKLKINPTDLRWWFWAITLGFMVAALVGWTPSYIIVMGISTLQVVFFLVQEKACLHSQSKFELHTSLSRSMAYGLG